MCVVEGGDLLSVPIANLENGRSCFDGAGNVLACARAGADGHFACGHDVLALIIYHGVCSWFHGGGGEAAGGGCVCPVLGVIVVPARLARVDGCVGEKGVPVNDPVEARVSA